MSAPNMPTLIPEVAFATTPADPAPTWVNVIADFRSGNPTRGRQQELDRYEAGRMDMVLNNRARTYDPEHTGGAHSPNVKPMRRSRLRATWNGVTYPIFDGYTDKWDQAYVPPREAIATLRATDGFKVLAKNALPRSVYTTTVAADLPALWYRLDEPAGALTLQNDGWLGRDYDGTLTTDFSFAIPPATGPAFGAEPLVVRDGGTAVHIDETHWIHNSVPNFSAWSAGNSLAVEAWVRVDEAPIAGSFTLLFFQQGVGLAGSGIGFAILDDMRPRMVVYNDAGTPYAVRSASALTIGEKYHLVGRMDDDGTLGVFVDAVDVSVADLGVGGTAAGTFTKGAGPVVAPKWYGFDVTIDELAVYVSPATEALGTGSIAAHNIAGRTPWADDLPGARLTRILDLAGWPAALRDLDTGSSTLQSATLNQTGLEHAQKVADSDFGQLFMTADGKVRFNGRSGLLNRVSAGTFGDGPGELPYAAIGFDNGDQLIRNPVTVSRTDGVPQTSSDAAGITEYLDHQYDVSGLLHDSDQLSKDAADFLVSEYKDPKTRVTTMVVAPQRSPTALWPVVLGAELGDVFTVIRRPQGLGTAISQDCEIQGIKHDIRPGEWTVTFTLSPAYTGATAAVPDGQFFQLNLTSGPGLDSLRLYF